LTRNTTTTPDGGVTGPPAGEPNPGSSTTGNGGRRGRVAGRIGGVAKQWVQYVMPIMVQVDDDSDEITRVVTLPEEIHEERDHRGHFLIYDERFVRRHSDDQPYLHAFSGGAEVALRPPVRRPSGELAGTAGVAGRLRPERG
jgi:hypothetical protein